MADIPPSFIRRGWRESPDHQTSQLWEW